MKKVIIGTLTMLAGSALVGGCAYGPRYAPPPPSGWAGEGWPRHVRRCERRFPRYDPRTDTIHRAGGDYRCPL